MIHKFSFFFHFKCCCLYFVLTIQLDTSIHIFANTVHLFQNFMHCKSQKNTIFCLHCYNFVQFNAIRRKRSRLQNLCPISTVYIRSSTIKICSNQAYIVVLQCFFSWNALIYNVSIGHVHMCSHISNVISYIIISDVLLSSVTTFKQNETNASYRI